MVKNRIIVLILQTIPALRAIPGFGGSPIGNGAAPVPNKKLNDAIEEVFPLSLENMLNHFNF